jgi:hypothetical protein
MMKSRWIAVAAVALSVLGGCNADKGKEEVVFPCNVFTQEEIEALAGNPLGIGRYTFENLTEDGSSYGGESCSWSTVGGKGNEISIRVSLAKHFGAGQVECYPPPGAGTDDPQAPKKISLIGDQAWWSYRKNYGVGTLRVCSPKELLEVTIDLAGDNEMTALEMTRTVAEKVLAAR